MVARMMPGIPPDHEKSAMMQMLLDSQGREIQLRAALNRTQIALNTATEALKRLTPPPTQPEGQPDVLP
jgi:hypothetical protein